MRFHSAAVVSALALSMLAGCATDEADPRPPTPSPPDAVALEPWLTGFDNPLHALEQDGTIYVVERAGRVHAEDGTRSVFLDWTDRVGATGQEQGLLGLAPHKGGWLVSYTDADGASVLSYLSGGEESILLTVDQPFSNHNGGHVAIGPDGMVYWGLGDGGAAADPGGNGQNPATLLGSILRIDVAADGTYTVPADNPFVGDPRGADEVWTYGLRNPWRFSFDAETGDLWLGDVGQNAWEEVNHIPFDEAGGANFGWNMYEGTHQFPSGADAVRAPGYVFPVAEYANDADTCSVTGGVVYHGEAIPFLQGHYLYGDFCSGTIWHMASPEHAPAVLVETQVAIAGFGVDGDGEVLVAGLLGGTIHRLMPAWTGTDGA